MTTRNTHCSHPHRFDAGHPAAERGTRVVMFITALTMVVEIIAGWTFNSMALLADGWHMSSHALALGLSAFAYAAARRYAGDPRFAFGTWKIEILAGFASAMFLVFVAGSMAFGSVERLVSPRPIDFVDALWVAGAGLVVNIVCALILGHAHSHDHAHGDSGDHHHHDLNLKSAYLHVVTDAATSVLAILALLGGLHAGWNWLDPLMGIVGAVLVGLWAMGLMRDTGRILLDAEMDGPLAAAIRASLQEAALPGNPRVIDLHVWRVGQSRHALILSIDAQDAALTPADIKKALGRHPELIHISVEINRTYNTD